MSRVSSCFEISFSLYCTRNILGTLPRIWIRINTLYNDRSILVALHLGNPPVLRFQFLWRVRKITRKDLNLFLSWLFLARALAQSAGNPLGQFSISTQLRQKAMLCHIMYYTARTITPLVLRITSCCLHYFETFRMGQVSFLSISGLL